MVDLAFSTNAYTNHSLTAALDRIADAGYDGVELLADRPHAYLPEFDDDDRADLADALDATGLAVSNVNANTATGYYADAPPSPFFDPSLCTDDGDHRAWRVDYSKRAIDLAAAVGAPAVCVASGATLPGNPPERAYDNLLSSLDEVTAYAGERGVEVGIEFEPELLVETVDEVLDLIDDVDHPALGINLDLGHAAVAGDDPAEAVRRSAGHITGVHVEDIPGGVNGKHYHTIPGEGGLDFAPVFDAFDDAGYDGFVTLELYTYPDRPDEAAAAAFEHLRQFV